MNFEIANKGLVSNAFIKLGIADFESACQYIQQLAYQRNVDKNNILCVLEENGGTCSTKHAVLRKLALENNKKEIRLMLGIFKMDGQYASRILKTLNALGLNFIPEAHNYLKIGEKYLDVTISGSNYEADIKPRLFNGARN